MSRRPLQKILLAALAPLLLGLTQCDQVKALVAPAPPKPTPYDFTITLEMTPGAAARLKATGNDLRVTAFYYGLATPENRSKADEFNRLSLGFQAETYGMDARKVRVISYALDPKKLPQVINKEPYVFLTVSAMTAKGYEDQDTGNKISCDGYTGPIALAQTAPRVVHCDIYRP